MPCIRSESLVLRYIQTLAFQFSKAENSMLDFISGLVQLAESSKLALRWSAVKRRSFEICFDKWHFRQIFMFIKRFHDAFKLFSFLIHRFYTYRSKPRLRNFTRNRQIRLRLLTHFFPSQPYLHQMLLHRRQILKNTSVRISIKLRCQPLLRLSRFEHLHQRNHPLLLIL